MFFLNKIKIYIYIHTQEKVTKMPGAIADHATHRTVQICWIRQVLADGCPKSPEQPQLRGAATRTSLEIPSGNKKSPPDLMWLLKSGELKLMGHGFWLQLQNT